MIPKKYSLVPVLLILTMRLVPAAVVHVSIVDFTYVPDTAHIMANDSVVWTNNSPYYDHTTTSGANGVPNGLWNSGSLTPGQSYGHKFTTNGLFPYYCAIHYPIYAMAGAISVTFSGTSENDPGRKNLSQLVGAMPNPFTQKISLDYQLAGSGWFGVEVYDALGRLAAFPASGLSESGMHVVEWNGLDMRNRPVQPGAYFVRLVTSGGSSTLRILKTQ